MANIAALLSQPGKRDIQMQGDRIAQMLRQAAQPPQPDIGTELDALGRMKSASIANVSNPSMPTGRSAYDERMDQFRAEHDQSLKRQIEAEQTAYENLVRAREMGNQDADRMLQLATTIAGEDAMRLINIMEEEIPEEIGPENFLTLALSKAKEKGLMQTGDFSRKKEALQLEVLQSRIDANRARANKISASPGYNKNTSTATLKSFINRVGMEYPDVISGETGYWSDDIEPDAAKRLESSFLKHYRAAGDFEHAYSSAMQEVTGGRGLVDKGGIFNTLYGVDVPQSDITREDIAYTAKQHGISEQEVMERLGITEDEVQ